MKKTMALILAITMMLSLGLCGCGGGCGDGVRTDPNSASAADDESPAVEEQSAEKDELTPDDEVRELLNSLMLIEYGDDVFSWNEAAYDPSYYGYERPENFSASYYAYMPGSDEEHELLNDLLSIQDELNAIDRESLSLEGKEYYDIIENNLYASIPSCDSTDSLYLLALSGFINAGGGMVSYFAWCFEALKWNSPEIFRDIIDITADTKECFSTYAEYARDRIAADIPINDYSLYEMIAYIDGVIEEGDNYYLYSIYENALNETDLIPEEEKAQYIEDFSAAMKECFFPALQSLRDELEECTGYILAEEQSGSSLAYYGELGEEYYEWLLECKTGMKNINKDEFFTFLENSFTRSINELIEADNEANELMESNPEEYDKFIRAYNSEEDFLGMTEYREMTDKCMELSESIVYPLGYDVDIEFAETDESAQEYTSYAAYYASTYFDTIQDAEYICVNPLYFENYYSYLYSSLSHEGYPGHLYQAILMRDNGLHCMAFAGGSLSSIEGWAQYASGKLMEKTAEASESIGESLGVRMSLAETRYNYYFDCLFDYISNDLGMNREEIRSYLSEKYGLEYDYDSLSYFIMYVSDNPADFISYGYSWAEMEEIHERASECPDYDEREFNELILLYGNAGTDALEELTDMYIAEHS